MDVRLCFMPCSLSESDLKDRVAVVIDILRASTSICTALANGCREIIPVASLEEATSMHAVLDRDRVLLCGERHGQKVEGFDLGNSPAEYSEDVVRDRTLVFASTNGSGTMVRCRSSRSILVGGFVNLSAIASTLTAYEQDVTIACSGREGGFSLEDSLCGGMLVERLVRSGFEIGNDSARIGLLMYKEYADSLQQTVRGSEHGRYLESLGFAEDIMVATALDTIDVVPVWDEGRLIAAG